MCPGNVQKIEGKIYRKSVSFIIHHSSIQNSPSISCGGIIQQGKQCRMRISQNLSIPCLSWPETAHYGTKTYTMTWYAKHYSLVEKWIKCHMSFWPCIFSALTTVTLVFLFMQVTSCLISKSIVNFTLSPALLLPYNHSKIMRSMKVE